MSSNPAADASAQVDSSEEGAWQPNPTFLKSLAELGISKSLATKALLRTGNTSADTAALWIFNKRLNLGVEDADEDEDDADYDVYKMVFLVNVELQMGVGKVAAQVAHAALGMHRLLLQDEGKYGEMLLEWQTLGETKIVLRGENTQHLVDLEKQALAIGLPTYMVQDAGKTQIPEGSTTVLCIMGRIDLVDRVTGKLRLL